MPAPHSDAVTAAASPGSSRDATEEGGEQRVVGTAPGVAHEGAAAELQACSGRKAMEHALLAVQEQLANVEEQVRGFAARSWRSCAVQSMMPSAHISNSFEL